MPRASSIKQGDIQHQRFQLEIRAKIVQQCIETRQLQRRAKLMEDQAALDIADKYWQNWLTDQVDKHE